MMQKMTREEALELANPIIVRADRYVRELLDGSEAVDLETCGVLYQLLVMGAVGVLVGRQPRAHVAGLLRQFADLIEGQQQQ
jgi:hypothetical protein